MIIHMKKPRRHVWSVAYTGVARKPRTAHGIKRHQTLHKACTTQSVWSNMNTCSALQETQGEEACECATYAKLVYLCAYACVCVCVRVCACACVSVCVGMGGWGRGVRGWGGGEADCEQVMSGVCVCVSNVEAHACRLRNVYASHKLGCRAHRPPAKMARYRSQHLCGPFQPIAV